MQVNFFQIMLIPHLFWGIIIAENGGVAQSVEQTAHIRYVGGSIPSAAIF